MAFAVTNVISSQSIISIMLRQRLLRLQRAYYQSQLIEVDPRRKQLLKALLEPALADELEYQS